MPNTGKPSPNCNLCRARRVKCDLGRPSCQRCIKYGVQCPGYRDQEALMWRSVNPSTDQKRTIKKAKKRAEQTDEAESPGSSTSASRRSTPSSFIDFCDNHPDVVTLLPESMELVPSTTSASAQQHLPLTKPLNEHWTAHSIPIILNVYSTLDFLSGMYGSCPSDGPLVWAAHLFTRTYVINLRYPTAIHNESVAESHRELGGYMGKTLSAVSAALQTPQGASRDDILATVWILSNYELLVGSIGQTKIPSAWHLHTRGLYSILKTRGIRSLRSEVGRTAFWSALCLVQINSIITCKDGPPGVDEWLVFIRENMAEDEHVALAVGIFMHKAAAIQSRIISILHRNDYEAASEEYLALVDRLTRAENESTMSLAAVPIVGDEFDAYWRTIYSAALVRCYHVTHLLINFLSHYSVCLIPLDQLRDHRDYYLHKVRSVSDEVLSWSTTILDPRGIRADNSPKALFDALKVVWPLTEVYVNSSTLPYQKSQAEGALYFIGRELGIRQALNANPGSSASQLPPEAKVPLGIGKPENVQWVGLLR